ncbi:MAG: hypothetical protein IPN53_02790 [Comamonadaceae bacterium]|nr:hypothetical protein [Comamonadaceae bacterium]
MISHHVVLPVPESAGDDSHRMMSSNFHKSVKHRLSNYGSYQSCINHQTIKPSNHQTIKPSNHQTRVAPKLTSAAAALALLLGSVSSAWAQVACPGVCVGYTTAGSVQSVPLTPGAMALLALLMVGAAYLAFRQKSGSLMVLCLAVTLGLLGWVADVRQASAIPTSTVVLTAGTNPGTLALPDVFGGPVDVQNTLSTPVTITSITVKSTLANRLIVPTLLAVGSTLAAGGDFGWRIFYLPRWYRT